MSSWIGVASVSLCLSLSCNIPRGSEEYRVFLTVAHKTCLVHFQAAVPTGRGIEFLVGRVLFLPVDSLGYYNTMSTAALLSTHSSNPLEVGSSDRQNRAYRSRFQAAKREHGGTDNLSSDDPLNCFNAPELLNYQNHISGLFGDATMTASRTNTTTSVSTARKKGWYDRAFVDLDEDMDSDEDAGAVEAVAALEQELEMDDDFGEEVEEIEVVDVDEVDEFDEEDAQGETDEEMTIHLKPPEEQEEIAEEIADLESAVPQLVQDYKVVDRLGTGTFSSVYKAIDLHYHDKWDNSVWHGLHPEGSSAYYQSASRPPDTKVFVAVKRIYVTSGPERIKNEITIMMDCRGCRHVSQLITAFRQYDQVVAIMPYHKHEDFRVSTL